MTPLVPLVMFGWIPFVFYLFMRFPSQRAVVIAFVIAWLFLPQAGYPLPGLPDYTKMSATCYGIMLATALFDGDRFTKFTPSWVDIPMVICCVSPLITSLTNGLGLYDGFSALLDQTVTWGLPYFLGRLYIGNWAGLKYLATIIFMGGLAYVPLCFIELVISPQLHRIFYGFHAARFDQAIRYGGYRPSVFMQHGLAVGAWMMAATLISIWLWQAGIFKKFLGIPMKILVAVMVVMLVLVKSTGAYILFVLGLACMWLAKRHKKTFLVTMLAATVAVYLGVAASGVITPESREEFMTRLEQVLPEERVGSLRFRLINEEMLSEKARERPLFGWGGWGRARIYNEEGEDISVTDSLWIIAFGNRGAIGLASLFGSFLLPVVAFCWSNYPGRLWMHPVVAPAAMISVVLVLFMVDCVLNAMTNPVYTLAAGGLSGLVATQPAVMPRKRRRPRRKPRVSPQPVPDDAYAIAPD